MNAPASPQPGTFGARGVALSSPSGVRLQPGFRHPGDHRNRTTWRGRRALRFSPSTSEAAGRVAPDMDVDMDARRAASGRPASMRRQRSIKRRQRPQLHDHVVARTYHLPKRHLSERLADEIQALNLSSARGYNPAAASSRPQPLHNQKFYRPPPMLRVPTADLGACVCCVHMCVVAHRVRAPQATRRSGLGLVQCRRHHAPATDGGASPSRNTRPSNAS